MFQIGKLTHTNCLSGNTVEKSQFCCEVRSFVGVEFPDFASLTSQVSVLAQVQKHYMVKIRICLAIETDFVNLSYFTLHGLSRSRHRKLVLSALLIGTSY